MRPPTLYKEIRPVAKKARAQGWRIEGTRGGHNVWVSPRGQRIYGAASPTDRRGMKNFIAQLRRAGYRG